MSACTFNNTDVDMKDCDDERIMENVSIEVRFFLPKINNDENTTSINDDKTIYVKQIFNDTEKDDARIGLPPEVVSPEKPENGDFKYSGMHDHGPIHPVPKEGGGTFSRLIRYADEARHASNTLLTQFIENEKRARKSSSDNKRKAPEQ